MTEIFENLKTLQEILGEKYSIEQEIENAPKKLSSQDELLARLKKEFIVKNTEYEEVRAKVLKLKADLAEAESAREMGEKNMESISTHREYEVLEKAIKDSTDLEQSVRKELHREEKNLAELNDKLQQDEELIKSQESELNEHKLQMEQEVSVMRKNLENLEKKEAKLIPGIDSDIVFKFERIIKNKQTGIVAVKGNVCDGCHMILPAQFANEVHKGDDIHFCPYCSRILFYQEPEDGDTEFFQLDDTGSLEGFDEDDFSDEDSDDEDEDSRAMSDSATMSGMDYDE